MDGGLRLRYEGLKFRGTLTDLKKFLEEKVAMEEMNDILLEKDKEDEKAMREYMFQGDNMTFSG